MKTILISMSFGMIAVTMLSPSIAAPKLKAKAESKAQSDQFDLACTSTNVGTGETNPPDQLHIDLAKQQWCNDVAFKCDANPQQLLAEADTLWLVRGKIDTSWPGPGIRVMNYWIDRKSGAIHYTDEITGQPTRRDEGMCQPQPYGTKPRNHF